MGRRIEVRAVAAISSMLQSRRAASSDDTMTANGLSSRAFRRRSSVTASWSVASATRWYPPMPFIATMRPDAIASSAASSATGPNSCVGGHGRAPDQLRATHRAGVGLGVEAAICWVVVFGLASGTHRESGHGRRRPVVRNAEHDGVPRAAVRAVREGVAVAPVVGVVDLGEAVVAGCGIDADRHIGGSGVAAFDDVEAVGRRGRSRQLFGGDAGHPRQRRGVIDEQAGQLGDGFGRALDLDQHTRAVIQHVSDQAESDRMAVHEWAEADALHGARDPQPLSGGRPG